MNNLENSIFESAVELSDKVGIKAIIVFADLIGDMRVFDKVKDSVRIILVAQNRNIPPEIIDGLSFIQLPKVVLSRMGLVKVSIMMAISAGYLNDSDKVICLSGIEKAGYIDSLIIVDLEKESEIIISSDSCGISNEVKPEVFTKVLSICVELAKQGRESEPVGAIFVIGDHKNVLNRSRQLIMNPFHGYPDHEKQILNPTLRETIKEFSSIDGAFIIRGDGIVLSAGRHLNTSLDAEELTPGLGCRHAAAAGITSQTRSVALVISQSTGSVRIFKAGKVIMKIEKTVT